jgi:Tfp pilus assembly protein PilN
MFKINLVPEVQVKKQEVKKFNTYATTFSVVLLSVIILAILIIGGVNVAQQSQISQTANTIKSTQSEIDQYKELEQTVISLEKGLAGIKQISDGENRWTKLFPHLEKATPADIQFTKLNLSNGKIEASLVGQNINSLARFLDSFKGYQVIAITGSGVAGTTVNIKVDSGDSQAVMVKTNGTWIYAANFDPVTDHTITAQGSASDAKIINIKYTAADKKIVSDDTSVKAGTKNLFSGVETTQYTKKDESVTFDSTFSFDGSALW